jgi:hypothetical protein
MMAPGVQKVLAHANAISCENGDIRDRQFTADSGSQATRRKQNKQRRESGRKEGPALASFLDFPIKKFMT